MRGGVGLETGLVDHVFPDRNVATGEERLGQRNADRVAVVIGGQITQALDLRVDEQPEDVRDLVELELRLRVEASDLLERPGCVVNAHGITIGVQLHFAFFIRQSALTNRVVVRIVFDDRYGRDHRV